MESFDMSHPIDQLDNSRDVATCHEKSTEDATIAGIEPFFGDPPEETRTVILHAEGRPFVAGNFAQFGLAVSFIRLGIRAGAVVACSIPLVLAAVFVGMEFAGIDLQRVSLGALIIALGFLADDATVETMVTQLEAGIEKTKAATFAYTSTAFPMLTGPLVTVAGFVPIGFAKSAAGEYTFSLFAAVALALLLSWVVAVLFSPLIGVAILPDEVKHTHGMVARPNHGRLSPRVDGSHACQMAHHRRDIGNVTKGSAIATDGGGSNAIKTMVAQGLSGYLSRIARLFSLNSSTAGL
jgi:multidrug efflux pump subunit AcrB